MAVSIQGENFGARLTDIDGVNVIANMAGGGRTEVSCESVALNGDQVDCIVPLLNTTLLAGGQYHVKVSVAGQSSALSAATSIVVIGRPQVSYVSPALGSVVGGYDVTIKGSNFGLQSDDVKAVVFGETFVEQVEFIDSNTLLVSAPPGAGSKLSIDVVTKANLRSATSPAFSYFSPVITSLTPSYAFRGNILSDFVIQGRELGSSLADVDVVLVGGVPCGKLLHVSSEDIHCLQVNSTGWNDGQVTVRVKGQLSQTNTLLQVMPDPEVMTVSPDVAGPGEPILVFGRNFGFNGSDVVAV